MGRAMSTSFETMQVEPASLAVLLEVGSRASGQHLAVVQKVGFELYVQRTVGPLIYLVSDVRSPLQRWPAGAAPENWQPFP